jgi:hypothetical protein
MQADNERLLEEYRQQCAYFNWLNNGCPPSSEASDWAFALSRFPDVDRLRVTVAPPNASEMHGDSIPTMTASAAKMASEVAESVETKTTTVARPKRRPAKKR